MARINPHINFNGNAEEAFTFYKSVFGGEFSNITRFKDIASDEFPVSDKEADKIMKLPYQYTKVMYLWEMMFQKAWDEPMKMKTGLK